MARCPNCTETLHRGAEGDYPAQCPKCGVRLKAKTKRVAPVTVPHTPPAAEERVVRSFSARRQAPPPAVDPIPVAADPNPHVADPIPVVAETVADDVTPTFPEESPPPPTEQPPFPSAAAVNPFAPPGADAQPAASAVAPVNPFGASEIAASKTRAPKTGLVKAVVAATLVAALAGVGAWYGKDLLKGPPPKERAGFQNPGRNYVFYAMPAPWKTDDVRAKRAAYDLVLHRSDLGGWITLRSELVKEDALDPKDAADEIAAKWKDRVLDFAPSGQLGKAKLAGRDAVVVEGEGTLDGKSVRGRTVFLVAGGVKYAMGFEAPIDQWEVLERDFALARENLELTGGSAAPAKVLGENAVAEFESKKFPYRLTAPAGKWREVPDLQTESRFDDLKLQDKARLGEVVVQVRETKDLPGMRVRYVETQMKLYENKVREVESAIEKMTIHGRPAMRTMLIVSNAGGDFMLYTTFVQGEGVVYRIQCRAPVDKRDVYEPLFEKISNTFEVLKRPESTLEVKTEEPKQAKKTPEEPKAKADSAAPPKQDAADKEPKKVEPKPKAEMKSSEKKPDDAKAKPADASKKPEPAKKKKSLDDLD